jgi:hypothetical protein
MIVKIHLNNQHPAPGVAGRSVSLRVIAVADGGSAMEQTIGRAYR